MNFARKRESFLAGIRTNFLGFWVKADRYGGNFLDLEILLTNFGYWKDQRSGWNWT